MITNFPYRRRKFRAYLLFAGVVLLLDQISKQAAYTFLLGQPPLEILPFFQLVLVFNEGAAFGFLNTAGGWQHYFLGGLAILVSLILVLWLWRNVHHNAPHNAMLSWALTLVLGGALGNLMDRISHQHVIDFISLHYANWYFPAFNLADSAISLGALGLIADSFGWHVRSGGTKREG